MVTDKKKPKKHRWGEAEVNKVGSLGKVLIYELKHSIYTKVHIKKPLYPLNIIP
jgi:hypothetical protein